MSRDILKDWPVKYFRPEEIVPRYASISWRKLVNDELVPDDGKPGIAFVGVGDGFPYALYVEVPYRENILAEGETREGDYCRHYETRDGLPNFDESYFDRYQHPNELASRRAMDLCCKENGCANGDSLSMTPRIPEDEIQSRCAYCANGSLGHRRDKLEEDLRSRRDSVDWNQKQVEKAELDILNYREIAEKQRVRADSLEDELNTVKEKLNLLEEKT